jgi:hypothetical protein
VEGRRGRKQKKKGSIRSSQLLKTNKHVHRPRIGPFCHRHKHLECEMYIEPVNLFQITVQSILFCFSPLAVDFLILLLGVVCHSVQAITLCIYFFDWAGRRIASVKDGGSRDCNRIPRRRSVAVIADDDDHHSTVFAD